MVKSAILVEALVEDPLESDKVWVLEACGVS